jgi:hypothetical protein
MGVVDSVTIAETRDCALKTGVWSKLGAIAILVWVGFAFRVWQLGTQSLWHDEAWSIFSAYHPFAFGQLGTDPNAPFAFYASLGAFMQGVGDSVWALRYWSVLWGVLTVAIAVRVMKPYGDLAAWVTGALVAINPILWVFSQEIRAYIVIPLAAILLIPLSEAVIRDGSLRAWLGLAVVELLALYSQNLAVPLVAWLNFSVGAILLRRGQFKRLAVWLGVQVALGVCYVPWLLTQRPTGTPLNTPPPLDLSLIGQIWQSYFTGIQRMINADVVLLSGLALFAGVAVICGGIALYRYRTLRTTLLLSQVILLPIFETAIILAAHIDFHPRYFIVGVPATLMLIAAAFGGQHGVRLKWAMAGLVIGLAGGLTMRMVTLLYSSPIYQHDDFRAIAAHYATLSANDAILIPYGWEPTLDYYEEKMGFKARLIPIPLYSSAETVTERVKETISATGRVEFLTWYQLPADIRGAYPCLLEGYGVFEQEKVVQGLKTVRYRDFQPDREWVTLNSESEQPIGFGGLRVNSSGDVQLLPSMSGGCLRTQWSVTGRVTERYSYSPALYLESGSEKVELGVTSTALYDERGWDTLRWTPGSRQTTLTWIATPPTLANAQGRYTFAPKVFSTQFPYGVDVNRAGESLGKRPEIGDFAISGTQRIPSLAQAIGLQPPTTPPLYTRPLLDGVTVTDGKFPIADLLTISIQEPIRAGNPVQVEMVWQAIRPSPFTQRIRVFIQLVTPQDQVIAQSDHELAQGVRSAGWWQPGEFLLDESDLQFSQADYRGSVRLIVGFYDTVTFERLRTPDGRDHWVYPSPLRVE